jgi:integrase
MSPGMKKKREHGVPLSARCVEILEEAKELSEGDYIFPGGKTGRPLSDMGHEHGEAAHGLERLRL